MDFPLDFSGGPRTLDVTMRVYDRHRDLATLLDPAETFVQRDEDSQAVTSSVTISHEDWLDFGSPDQLTVAITPGDSLNA
jgi:hypothetical protein